MNGAFNIGPVFAWARVSVPAEARGGHQVSCFVTLYLILLRKGISLNLG